MSDDLVTLIMRRPKVALRRIKDPMLYRAVQSYILNRKTKAAANALEYVKKLLGRG